MAWLFKGLAWLLLGVLALGVIWWSWNAGFELFWPFVGLLVAGISLHRSVKAFVEFWRGRISERVEIEVAVANLLLFWTSTAFSGPQACPLMEAFPVERTQ